MLLRKITFLLFFFSCCTLLTAQSSLWQNVDVNAQTQRFDNTGKAFIPNNSRALTLNTEAMKEILWQAPTVNQRTIQGAMIDIPKQHGGFETYEVYQNVNIFAENIRSEYENTIRAFTGHKVGDEHTQIHLTLGYDMFNAAVYRPDSNIDYVEYASDIKNNTFFVYRRGDETLEKIKCGYIAIEKEIQASQRSNGPTDQETFRINMTTAASFSLQFGDADPTVAEIQAVITGQLNNILNPIFNRDFGIVLLNATINESIFVTAGTNTPFSNEGDSGVVADENSVFLNEGQTNSFVNIETDDYDIGHAQVYEDTGGVARGDAVCDDDTETKMEGTVNGQQGILKSCAMSGTAYPLLNDFTVDYVAHEIGHQFGCNHSYSTVEAEDEGCDTGWDSARYETGSGTTIMSYIGVCGNSNVYPDNKDRADPFFHSHNIDEAIAFINTTFCGNITTAVNTADPVITPDVATISIPKGTPFALVGTVTDDGSSTVAAWNQYDLAPNNYDGGDAANYGPTTVGPPLSTNTSGPMMRFQIPVAPDANNKTKRIMPSNAQTGDTQDWEVLPTVARTMTFRLLARDNQVGANAFGRTAIGVTTVTVTNDGPMAVTQPSNNQNTAQGDNVTVAFTGLPSSICATVDLFLSTDGGMNYSTTALATNVANSGSHTVTLPVGTAITSDARILVQCHTTSGELLSSSTPFQISSSFNITAALPVELSDIWAKGLSKTNQVAWTTASEINNEGFEIERSANSRDWGKVGFVAGAGNSDTPQNYEWIDANPLSPVSYYRLRQIDFDGQFSYSKVVKVTRGNETNEISIFPNPNKGTFQVTWSENNNTPVQMDLFDITGRLIFSQTLTNSNEFVSIGNLANGTYFVTLQTDTERFVKKIVKQ